MNNDFTTLINGVNDTASRIKEIISSKKNILIIGHMDADGIASSSVMARKIQREGGRFNLRIMSEMTIKELENISGEVVKSTMEFLDDEGKSSFSMDMEILSAKRVPYDSSIFILPNTYKLVDELD